MKTDIHPNWNDQTPVSCSCGATFTTGSVLSEIKVEICSACHPFYTGEMRFVDTQGRVEKFQAKQKLGRAYQQAKKKQAAKKTGGTDQAKSLKDMLQDIKQTHIENEKEPITSNQAAKQ